MRASQELPVDDHYPALIEQEEIPDIDALSAMVNELGESALLPEELAAYKAANPMAAKLGKEGFYDNLAEYADSTALGTLATYVIQHVQWDEQSREDWQKRESKGIRLLGVTDKVEGGANFKGASRAVHPLLAEAATQFHARAITEMWPADGPVKTQVLGEPSEAAQDQAKRVEDYMNYLYTVRMPGAFEEEDQMLFRLPISGSCFKKIYYDPIEKCLMSVMVEPSDFIVPFTATSLRSAPRYTHRIRISQNDLTKRMKSGYYLDIDLTKPANESYDYPEVKTEIDKSEGRTNNLMPEDQRHTLYECYLDYDLPGFEDSDETGEKTGIALSYVVTVDRDNQRVLRIQRNWRPTDELRLKRLCFAHYKFTPGFGFYGYGLPHLIGGLASSATGSLRALLDSAQFSNMQGGFRSRDAKIDGKDMSIGPGEWREVDSSAEELSKAFFKLPYQFEGEALFKLLGYLDERAQRFAGTTENMVGEANNSAPVGTTLALIEQGSKQFTAIHMRLHLAHAEEYRITAELCAEYLPEEGYPYATRDGQNMIMARDFDSRIDVIPVSDPNIISSTQRIAQAQAVLDLAQKFPGQVDATVAIRRMLSAMRVQGIDEIMPNAGQPDPMQQKMQELEIRIKEAELKKLEAEEFHIHAQGVVRNIEGLFSAVQAALATLTNQAAVPVADSIAKSSGFTDADNDRQLIAMPQTPIIQQDMPQPIQNTNPLTPANPLQPESPFIGAERGIETLENDA